MMALSGRNRARRCSAVVLSGNDLDGVRGMSEVAAQGGETLVLDPRACLSSRLVQTVKNRLSEVQQVSSEGELARMVMELCRKSSTGDGPLL